MFLLSTLGSAATSAQEPAQEDSVRAVEVRGVTVTVLRTPIPLTRAPYAVSVVESGVAHAARPHLGLDEALRTIPGVQVDNRYNYALGERISIRGFGARAQFGVRGVRVLVDGIPATFPDGQTSLSHLDLGFLSRAEVVRGPSSAIYGASSGGVIQLETYLPEPGGQVREAAMAAGSHGLLRAHAAIGEATGRAAYALRLSHQGFDGARDYSDARNLRLHASGRYSFPGADLSVTAAAVEYEAQNPGSLSETLLAEDRTQAYANNVAQRTGEDGHQAQLGATLRRAVGPGEVEIAAYGIARSVVNPIPAAIVDLDRRVAGLRGLYRASGQRAAIALGAEGATQRDDRLNFANEAGEPGVRTLDQAETVGNVAVFGQASVRPVEPLTLVAGLRYDLYRFSAYDRLIGPDDPDDSGSIDMAELSPSVGASASLSRLLNVYANVATAFETPTTTELGNRPDGSGGFNPSLRPQESVSYEAGIKGAGADVSYELAVYTADVDDALIPFEIESAPDRQFFRNAGSARHRGVETGVRLAPSRWLAVRASYTLTSAHFTSFQVAGTSYDGNRVPGIAPHRVDAVVEVTSEGSYLALDARYASRTPVDDANEHHSAGYFVSDLRAGIRGLAAGEVKIEPFVGVQNLLDAEFNSSVVVNAFGRRYFEPAPGRTVHVGLRARF